MKIKNQHYLTLYNYIEQELLIESAKIGNNKKNPITPFPVRSIKMNPEKVY